MVCYFCKIRSKQAFVLTRGRSNKMIKRFYTIQNITHHIDTNRKNNSRENLIKLCPPCHLKLHKLYRAYKKFLNRV